MNGLTRSAVGLGLLALAASPAFGQASLGRNNPATPATLTRATILHASDRVAGPLAASVSLHIVVTLKLRNEAQLHAFLQRPSRQARMSAAPPALTPAQFTARYSPTVAQARAVAGFLKKAGFANVAVSPNRLLVSGDGSATVVEAAFHTRLVSVVTHDGRHAYANTSAPRVPASLQGTVLAVLGLQTVHVAHPLVRRSDLKQVVRPNTVAGHNPTDFAAIYDAGGAPTAAGVTIGIVSEGSMSNVLDDLDSFTSQNGLPAVDTQVVHTDGSSGDTSGDGEWDLDSQDIVGMAGGEVGKLIFYDIPSLQNADLTDDFNTIVTVNATKIINVSLGECETYAENDGSAAAQDQLFQEAMAQNQTFSVSSGDSGADECGDGGTTPSWPASSQYVVAVGGTTLNASGTTWNNETVWSGTGGSPSTFEAMPSWQEGVGQNAGHSTRGVPDVAFDANPNSGAVVIVDGRNEQIGGTSLASPLFVGLWARVIAAHGTDVGFAAPLIYQLPTGDFHDVTSGNNGGETAAPGWDYTTGFGSIKIADAVNDTGSGNPPPGNQPPVARNGSITTSENQSKNGTLSASDPDGDPLTFRIASQPDHGSVQITNLSTGAFTYSPDNNYTGSDSFGFKANDGQADSNTATESVTVNPTSGPCPAGFTHYSARVTQGNDSYQPNGNYYYAASGREKGQLHGPAGTDFDLYLYKYSYWYSWEVVARSTSATPNESINYNGSAGYYLWDIYAYSGSGTYDFCLKHP